jgi:hypothetical protein
MEGSSRLVCIAIARKHHAENNAAVEVNCQQGVIAAFVMGTAADGRLRQFDDNIGTLG